MQTLHDKNYVATPFGQHPKHSWPQSSVAGATHLDAFVQESVDNYVNVLPASSHSFMNLHEQVNGLSGEFAIFYIAKSMSLINFPVY